MNRTSRILSLAAAVALGTVAPAAAATTQTAYSAGAPVGVGTCQVAEAAINAGPEPGFLFYSRDLTYSFTNRANIPATSVVMTVNDGNATQTVSARGAFSPGVKITRSVDTGISPVATSPSAQCVVSRVDFADGTSWQPSSGIVAATH